MWWPSGSIGWTCSVGGHAGTVCVCSSVACLIFRRAADRRRKSGPVWMESVIATPWQRRLARSLPLYYGWVIFAVSAVVSYSSRPVMAVATLSIFLVPMTEEFGWSRGTFSSAVSAGCICAVAVSPLVGWCVDRYGPGTVVAVGGAVSGACAVGLSMVSQVWAFYALYVPGRAAFASPLELGTSIAVSNWFIRRRAFVLGLLTVTQGTGLALTPLVAYLIITEWSWRVDWVSMGIYAMAIGTLPALLLLVRRPEDLGLEADPAPDVAQSGESATSLSRPNSGLAPSSLEQDFTLRQALNTRACWLLAIFSAVGYMVQAGVSLHQVPHYIQQGLPGTASALTISTFALCQVPGGLLWATLVRWVPVRFLLAAAGLCVGAGAFGASVAGSLSGGLAAAAASGVGVGGLHVLLRLAWADYYGRRHLGSIRGLTLPVQLIGQAAGPILAGFLYDATGDYKIPFTIFAIAAFLGAIMVVNAKPPVKPAPAFPQG